MGIHESEKHNGKGENRSLQNDINEVLGGTISVEINGSKIIAPFGATILEVCRANNINVPTLCYHKDLCVAGNCRICLVEIEGLRTLQTSCTFPLTNSFKIHTSSPAIRNARRHIIELLLSEHCGECYSCVKNGKCELQRLAKEYGVDELTFGRSSLTKFEKDNSSPSISRDMNKCILCKRCVRTCLDLQGVGVLETLERGDKAKIGTFFDKPLGDVICINCGQCINRCPTGALYENDSSDSVWKALDNPKKHVVIQTAPAPRAAIGEEFGLPPGTSVTRELNTALKRIGFDRVFDTNFTADLTIMEEGTELILRLYKALVANEKTAVLPQFTSCSPGWVKYLEHFYPEYISNLSTAKSPQQMFGALIKTFYAEESGINPADIVTVALMPCTAKKFECKRSEMDDSGFTDVDYALTTRELAKMIKESGVRIPEMPKSDFDMPFGEASGAGLIFGATGGVMEAALRTVVELVTGEKAESLFDNANVIPVRGFEGIKYVELPIDKIGPVPEFLKKLVPDWKWLQGAVLKAAVVHGTANAKKVMDDIKKGGKFSECHFIEFMACPGGCLGGGGQPIPTNNEIREKRAEAIYKEDESLALRKSHENPHVMYLYEKFLTEGPCGHKSHELLHTDYVKRGKYIA